MEAEFLDVTRHFDVWSLGMTFIELVTLEPLLYAKYEEFGRDADQLMVWLADPATGVIELPDKIGLLDEQFADLCKRMIERNTDLRSSMVEVMLHPFFTGREAGGEGLIAQ